PPVGYTIPTVATDAVLQTLPGAPFALVTGSRGEVFTVNPGPVVRIDVPVDPQGDGLWLQKQANHDDATVGDFLQYRLTLENLSSVAPVANVIITDRLPTGFRYQHGSTTIDGVPLADPIINRDGQQLQFGLGNLAAEQRVDVTYVVEITAGTRQGEAINWAQAEDVTGQLSNVAKASVEILPLFFNDNAFLAGRVLSGSCEQDDREMTGVAGVRIFLEDGSYIVTDQNGRYHFEGIEPGVHVVQADIGSLPTGYEMLPCEQTSQTAGRTFSQFVDLQGGTLWRVNFYTAPKPALTGEVHLQMTAGLDAETATFDIDLAAHTVPAENLRLTFMLPGDAQYLPGTARMNSQSISDPEILSGAVTFRIKQIAADQPLQVSFQARLDDSQGSGELPAKAMLMFDTTTAKGQRTPIVETRFHLETGQIAEGEALKLYPRFPSFVAELQKTDRGMLDQLIERLGDEQIVRVDVVGHTDNQPIARRSRHIFADNQALSEARARSVAAYLQQYLDLPETILSVRGLGERMPVADNGTASGRALNRRVELNLATTGDAEPATLSLVQATSERKTVATTGPDPTEGSGVEVTSFNNVLPQPPQIDAAWRATAANKPSLVWPPEGYIPETPSLSVMVQYLRGDRVTLELNGAPVNPLNFDGVKSQNGSDLLVAIWHGVDLRAGQNHITAAIIDKHGNPTATLNREIWFVENAYQVELLPEQSQLLADGLQTPVLALRLTDDQGHPLRPGLYSDIEVAPPHQLRQTDKLEIEEPATIETGQPRFVTGPNGVVFVTLEPTTQSGQVNLTVPLPGGMTQDVRAWLKPSMRDWVLVGFAQGTIGYNTIDGNMQNLKSAGLEEDFYHDGRTKFFAKGAIKGEWLLTMAYDSDKPNLDGESLHQVIDP
ncbi:MAG: OmpA family protein, partial [Desulfuromonadales bacterium]|nr:OmpA family protein [Desulfuromonadales bacterium]